MTTPRFYDSIGLVATRSAIRCSRLFVICSLDKWGVRFVVNEAVYVVEKLAANAVMATGVMDERVRWTGLTRIEFIATYTLRLMRSSYVKKLYPYHLKLLEYSSFPCGLPIAEVLIWSWNRDRKHLRVAAKKTLSRPARTRRSAALTPHIQKGKLNDSWLD